MFIAACGQIWTVYLSSETRESKIGRDAADMPTAKGCNHPFLETKSFLLPCYLQEDLLGLNLNNFSSCIEFITGGDDVRFICSSRLEDRLRGCALVGGQACAK